MRDLFTLPNRWTPLDLPDADVSILHGLALPDGALEALIDETAWRQDDIVIFGKRVRQPRLHAWYGDPEAVYRYSGLRNVPLPWTPRLVDIRSRVEAASGCRFNSVLLNLYRDGRDAMGFHSDDEAELGSQPVIASLSLGATRTFVFKRRIHPPGPAVRIPLDHGTLLMMQGHTQANWLHGLPRSRRTHQPRLNLTFRTIRTLSAAAPC